MNVVAVVGRLSRPAEHRVLPSGDQLVAYEVTVNGTVEGKRETVPVVWFGASAAAGSLDTDERVLVVGRVRRRFFKTGGRTGSRTEVVADAVVPLCLASCTVTGAVFDFRRGVLSEREP